MEPIIYLISDSSLCVVADISLLNTTVRNDKTREVATISNGSLARSRIINARRSDKAQLMIYLKFGVDETFARKILLFQAAVKKFVHDRPHEFYRTVRFRSTSAESDLGFAEHVIVLQCKASWQQFEEVMESKAKVDSFSLEVQTKLGISYSPPPPMPVNPSQVKGDGGPSAPFITENSGVRANRRDSDMTYSLKTEDSSKVWRGSSTSKVDVIQHALSHLFERKKIR